MTRCIRERLKRSNLSLIDTAIDNFSGNAEELQNAVGAFFVGRLVGWRTLFLLHSPRSIKKYETLLGVNFRDHMPEIGPKARESVAWQKGQHVSNYWKLVKGEIPHQRTPDWNQFKQE